MISAFIDRLEKKEYFEPTVEVLAVNSDEDVICNSQLMNEDNDNDFGADSLGDFLDK